MIRLVTYVCAFGFLCFFFFAQDHAAQQLKSDRELYKIIDHSPYAEWLDQDVAYIISPKERTALLHLQTNEEREKFVAEFWQQRNPDPNFPGNRFEEEHYRRIMYVNEHYSAAIPGRKTDRGRIYIMYGPPKQIETGTVRRADCEVPGTADRDVFPAEIWHYSPMPSTNGPMQESLTFRFGDPTSRSDYFLCFNPKIDAATFSSTIDSQPRPMGIEPYSDAFKTPLADVRELEQIANSRAQHNDLKFDYRFDFIRCTSDTTLVRVAVQMPRREMEFEQKNGVAIARVYVFGRVRTLTGRVVAEFVDPVEVDAPAKQMSRVNRVSQIYQKSILLSPGLYTLDLIIEDRNSGKLNSIKTRVPVRTFAENRLDTASLILARPIFSTENSTGLSGFLLGDFKVVSRVDQSFPQAEGMGFFFQIYNLRTDEKTGRSNVSIHYRITPVTKRLSKEATKRPGPGPLMEGEISADDFIGKGVETTVAKNIDLSSLAPGEYGLQVTAADRLRGQTIISTADFTVVAASAP